MPIPVHDATTSYNGTATTHTSATHTITGSDPALLCAISYKDNGGGEVTGVQYAGAENFVQFSSESKNGEANSQMWSLAAPVATSGTVVVSTTNSVRLVFHVNSYTGCDQTNPLRAASANSANGTDGTLTVDITTLSVDELAVDAGSQVSAGPDTVTSQSGTSRGDAPESGGGTDARGVAQELTGTGGADTMSYTMSSSDNWAIIGGALQEPQALTDAVRDMIGIGIIPFARA